AQQVGARSRLGQRHRAVGVERRVVVHAPAAVEDAAVAVVGELVQAQVGLHDDGVPDLRDDVGDRGVEDPAGSHAALPTASRALGTPKSMTPPRPAAAASAAARRRLSRLCWTWPGIDAMGTGSVAPSRTKSGSTRWLGSTVVSATRRRSA